MKPMCLLPIALIASFSLLSPIAQADTYTKEEYQQIFAGDDTYKQEQAIESIFFVGLNDPSTYQSIKTKIDTLLPSAKDKHVIDNIAWLIKGLSYSGDPQFREYLNQLAQGDAHKKIRKYAKRALADLSKFEQWNPILQDKSQYNPEQSHRANVYAAALRSDNLELMRTTAKRIANERLFDNYMLQQLAAQLSPMRLIDDNKLAIDTYAWITRALATSGNEDFKADVEAVAQNAKQKKLRKYATKYLAKFY
ncbi:hypothetical protein [Shewanella sp. 10N.286.52.A9]|uniref:hypothetical protein n=1 Tax=Shewanella sp. 10N.286.52.A9 TaxID=3229711 RepID=UPI0035512324